MDATAIKAMMAEIAPVIREYFETEVAPVIAENKALAARVAELEVQLPVAAPLTVEQVRAVAAEEARSAVDALPNPEPLPDVAALAKEAAAEQVAVLSATLPLPERGERGEPGPEGKQGPAGEVDMDAVKALVEDAVAARPLPERGEKGERGEQGPAGPGIKAAIRDQDGVLLLTLSDGSVIECGNVVGPRGEKGEQGDTGERGENGERGERGERGETFTLDDFDIVPVDERTIKMGFTKGDVMHSFELEFPFPIYRGVFKETGTYERGDLVTWAGSMWHCDEPKGLKPGAPESGWQLAVKAGRPGKDAGK